MARLLVNPPCRFLFAGWESDSYKLGSMGWDISFEDDPMCRLKRAILHHRDSRLNIMAESREFDVFDWRQRGQVIHDLPVFEARRAFSDMRIVMQEGSSFGFTSWADTKPAIVEADLFSMPLFLSKQAPKGEELIVEPQDVMQLLEQIKRMQAPEQEEIRRRNRQTPVAHATILAFDRNAA